MTWALAGDLVIAAYLVLLADVDRRTGRLPNRLLTPLLAIALAAACVHPPAVAAALVAATVYLAGFLAHSCGGGDVKLAAGCGALLGSVAAALLAVAAAALLTVVLCLSTRRRAVPHGPALVAATLAVGALRLVSEL